MTPSPEARLRRKVQFASDRRGWRSVQAEPRAGATSANGPRRRSSPGWRLVDRRGRRGSGRPAGQRCEILLRVGFGQGAAREHRVELSSFEEAGLL